MVQSNIIQALFIVLPVFVTGVVFIAILKLGWIGFLRKPLDFGLTIKRKRIFGDNKTWLGFVVMTLGTSLSAIAIYNLGVIRIPFLKEMWLYEEILNSLIGGALLGLGYVIAELPNSFIKRRLNIDPGIQSIGIKGALFWVMDKVDSVIGGMLVAMMFFSIDTAVAWWILILGFMMHVLTDVLMKVLRLKKNA